MTKSFASPSSPDASQTALEVNLLVFFFFLGGGGWFDCSGTRAEVGMGSATFAEESLVSCLRFLLFPEGRCFTCTSLVITDLNLQSKLFLDNLYDFLFNPVEARHQYLQHTLLFFEPHHG